MQTVYKIEAVGLVTTSEIKAMNEWLYWHRKGKPVTATAETADGVREVTFYGYL